MSFGWRHTEVGRYDNVVGKDSCCLQKRGNLSGYQRGTNSAKMRATIVVAQQVMTFCIAITQIKILGGRGQVDERHIHLCSHLLHLVYIVHTMVCSWDFLILEHASIGQLTELIA